MILKRLLEDYAPDRIIIEPSGVGKLSDVIKAVQAVVTDKVCLNGFVTVADATKCKMYIKNFGEFYLNQIEYASTIVLSRTQNLSQEKLDAALTLIREHNSKARVVTTPWSEISGKNILTAIEGDNSFTEDLLKEAEVCPTCGHHHHHADEVFTSWGKETAKHFTKEEIEKILSALNDTEKYGFILRAKGIVAGENGEWIHFDFVPEESNVRNGSADYTGRLCVIGSKLNEAALAKLFDC